MKMQSHLLTRDLLRISASIGCKIVTYYGAQYARTNCWPILNSFFVSSTIFRLHRLNADPVQSLVLNKCDLLQAKLQRGIRIRDSVASFGDRKNDFPTATRCTSGLRCHTIEKLTWQCRFPTSFPGDRKTELDFSPKLVYSLDLCRCKQSRSLIFLFDSHISRRILGQRP